MTDAALNIPLLAILIATYAALAALRYSPEALDRVAMKMRARSRAMIASQKIFESVYAQSLRDDVRINQERVEARQVFEELANTGERE